MRGAPRPLSWRAAPNIRTKRKLTVTVTRRNVTLVGIAALSLGVLAASQVHKAQLAVSQTKAEEIKSDALTPRDASAGFKAQESDESEIARIDLRFVANGLWTTTEAVKRIKAAT